MNAIWDAEIGVIVWIQSIGRWLEPPMEVVTTLGSQSFFLTLLPLLFWCVSSGLGARLYLLLMSSALVNYLVKDLFYGARPPWFDAAVKPMTTESSFGLPSGHTQAATVVWGYLGVVTRMRWARWVAGVLIALVAFSRVFLGAHFITDVLVGLALGALLVWLALRYEEPVLRWWRERALAAQVAMAFVVSVVPAVVVWAWQSVVRAGWTAPDAWEGAVPAGVAAGGTEQIALVGGALFGGLAGFSVLAARGWYSAEGTLVSRVSRYVIGITGMVLIMVVLRVAVPEVNGVAGAVREYVGYTLLSLWGALGAPELFLRMRLAERPEQGDLWTSTGASPARSDPG